ncbi:MAG: hypothetical protein J6W35_02915 [Eubacterium sp.]|nr:hypothetical protein [Eubacterium sp.]
MKNSIAGIVFLVGVVVMVVWGQVGHAWNISWVAAFVGVIGSSIVKLAFNAKEESDAKKQQNQQAATPQPTAEATPVEPTVEEATTEETTDTTVE